MPAFAVGLLTAAAALTALGARLRIAFAVYVGAIFLVPPGVPVPQLTNANLSVHRVILVMLTANLARRLWTREAPMSVLRPSRLHAALVLWLGLTFLIGVGLANPELAQSSTMYLWLSIAEQTVFFIVAAAIMRNTEDLRWMATLLVGIFLATSTIAFAEHFTHWSYGRWFLHGGVGSAGPSAAAPLGVRGGDVRVRSAVQFSLAYAWIATMFLPLAIVVATRMRRIVALAAPAIIAITIVWTYTRSAYVGVALTAAGLVVASRFEARITRVVLAAALLGGLVVVNSNAIGRAFESQAENSIDVRFLRTPVVLEQVSNEPFLGKGLSGLASLGISSTDATFLLVYAELGVIGSAAFGLLLLTILIVVWPALRAPPGTHRALGAAVFVGLMASIGGAASFDEFQVFHSFSTVWILAALGTALAERVTGATTREPQRTRPRSLWALRLSRPLLAAGAGVGIGFLLLGTAPRANATTLVMTTLRPSAETGARPAPEFFARLLLNTSCQVINTIVERLPDTTVDCLDLRTRFGIGQLRVVVDPSASMDSRLRLLMAKTRAAIPSMRPFLVSLERGFRPTWARTAPVWMAIAAGGVAVLIQTGPERRRRRAPSAD